MLGSPSEQACARDKASAKRAHQQHIAPVQPFAPAEAVQQNGYAGRGCVAAGFDVRRKAFLGKAKPRPHRFYYAQICLMYQEIAHIPGAQVFRRQKRVGIRDSGCNGKLVYLLAVHMDVPARRVVRIWAAALAMPGKEYFRPALRPHLKTSLIAAARHNHSARAIAEQNAGRTVCPIAELASKQLLY